MKNIIEYITERYQNNASNKDAMFLHLDGLRQSEGFSFTEGEKALLLRYDTDAYRVDIHSVVEIEKVLKNSIRVKSENADSTDFYHSLKFDKTGIAIVKTNSKYRGKSTAYWVLYNKELINSDKDGKDITEILNTKGNSWGFRLFGHEDFQKRSIQTLKKYIKEIK